MIQALGQTEPSHPTLPHTPTRTIMHSSERGRACRARARGGTDQRATVERSRRLQRLETHSAPGGEDESGATLPETFCNE